MIAQALAVALAAIAFVPLDDRPVTAQLPPMLGAIAGVRVESPPGRDLGRYLARGDSDAVVRWLNRQSRDSQITAYVVSTDMLAYGGLVASRVPGASYADAYSRLAILKAIRARRPQAWIGAFGTIMRLAPTGTPAASGYFAAYPAWTFLQQYANLPDAATSDATAARRALEDRIGAPTLDAYRATRARNLAVDRHLLGLVADRTIDRLALGQDDAGPVGLHVAEVRLLQEEVSGLEIGARASIEPGADELGMAFVAGALARHARWTPRIGVRYSTATGSTYQDPLEFAPISAAIDALVGLCGGVRDDERPDVELYVRVPGTNAADDDAFVAAMKRDAEAGLPVALADLSFLKSYRDQASFAQRLLATGLAARLDAYASWNTNANTVGTALAEAVAAGAGRRTKTYDSLAHRTFTLVRFLDDFAFHDEVRPELNATLDAHGIADHTLLAPEVAAASAQFDRAMLWNRAQTIVTLLDPGYHIAAMQIELPWNRTFETRIDVGIAPNL
ncbi:MAG TPA: DUF4127 family protein [Candidatus Tumulicola sp.]